MIIVFKAVLVLAVVLFTIIFTRLWLELIMDIFIDKDKYYIINTIIYGFFAILMNFTLICTICFVLTVEVKGV